MENYLFKYIVVGAGLCGSIIAERIARVLGEKVLVIEKRRHIGGNCYDEVDSNGILVHRYGPHLFHTDIEEVFSYLSQFTEWEIYHHRVLAFVDGMKVPVPFNFNSMDRLFPPEFCRKIQHKLMDCYGLGSKVPILELMQNDDPDVKWLARYVYEKIFLGYTSKQWGKKPEEIDPEVTARVPVMVGRDDRYFQDRYQAVPKQGYTEIFRALLGHQNIKLMTNTDFKEIGFIRDDKVYLFGREFDGIFVYTGSIDELLEYRFGKLEYRSLDLEFESKKVPWFQEAASVNYPNNYDFTRITEFKHIHFANSETTTILKEYPKAYVPGKDIPYYPLFTQEARKAYLSYKEYIDRLPNIIPVGRLAEYRYYDMDDAVYRALTVFDEIRSKLTS
ncbi:MAG: UDP-galactopyranose mutase [Thermodesulforhabdaceae bacterium]